MQRRTLLVGGLLALAAVATGWWLARGDAPASTAERPALAPPTSPAVPAGTATPEAAAAASAAIASEPAIVPAHRIAESGRLSLAAADLPREGSLALALDLSDAARGSEPRPVRIVSQDGSRTLELAAAPLEGSGSGVALLIDPGWLTPDLYLVEVTTAEATHFPLRRYVLEVRGR